MVTAAHCVYSVDDEQVFLNVSQYGGGHLLKTSHKSIDTFRIDSIRGALPHSIAFVYVFLTVLTVLTYTCPDIRELGALGATSTEFVHSFVTF